MTQTMSNGAPTVSVRLMFTENASYNLLRYSMHDNSNSHRVAIALIDAAYSHFWTASTSLLIWSIFSHRVF